MDKAVPNGERPSREDALMAFAARMMWVAERTTEAAGKPVGEIQAGIAGMAVSVGISPADFMEICIDRMRFDDLMRKASGLDDLPILSKKEQHFDG